MAAPTPVSALLHAATIMVSGIFFILRLTRALFLTSTEGKGGNHAGCSRNVALLASYWSIIIGVNVAYVILCIISTLLKQGCGTG